MKSQNSHRVLLRKEKVSVRTGVFTITSWKTRKVYVGGGVDVDRTMSDLKSELKRGARKTQLFKDYRDLKGEGFEFEVIEECNRGDLRDRVDYWVKEYKSVETGYNKRRSSQKSDLSMRYKREWYKIKGNSIPDIC